MKGKREIGNSQGSEVRGQSNEDLSTKGKSVERKVEKIEMGMRMVMVMIVKSS